jgi:hypothetical protein
LGEAGDDLMQPLGFVSSALHLSLEERHSIAQLFDQLGLGAWYAGVGRLVRLRRTTAQQDKHSAAFFCRR